MESALIIGMARLYVQPSQPANRAEPGLRDGVSGGKCRRAPAVEDPVNTVTSAPLRTKRIT